MTVQLELTEQSQPRQLVVSYNDYSQTVAELCRQGAVVAMVESLPRQAQYRLSLIWPNNGLGPRHD